jgi:hypothetical protein
MCRTYAGICLWDQPDVVDWCLQRVSCPAVTEVLARAIFCIW